MNPVELSSELDSELQCARNVFDRDNCSKHIYNIVKENERHGLLLFEFTPRGKAVSERLSTDWALTARNVSAFIHTHKHSLIEVKVSFPSQDVLVALTECPKIHVCILRFTAWQIIKRKKNIIILIHCTVCLD